MVAINILVFVHDGNLNVVLVLFSSTQLHKLDVDQDRAEIEEGTEEICPSNNTGHRFSVNRVDGEH